jgi:hypothetical protein
MMTLELQELNNRQTIITKNIGGILNENQIAHVFNA